MSSDNLTKIIDQIIKSQEEVQKLDGQTDVLSSEFPVPRFDIKVTKVTSQADFARIMDKVNDLAIQYIRDDIKTALDAAMAANIWGDGEDIIDTGELMDSLQITISGNKVTMDYGADYAALVHYGGYVAPYGNKSIDKVYIPGRPWVDAVMQGYSGIEPVDLVAAYSKAFQYVVG